MGIFALFALGTQMVIIGCLRRRQSKNDLAVNKTKADSAANGQTTAAAAEGLVLLAQASSAESELSQNSNSSTEFESRFEFFSLIRTQGRRGI